MCLQSVFNLAAPWQNKQPERNESAVIYPFLFFCQCFCFPFLYGSLLPALPWAGEPLPRGACGRIPRSQPSEHLPGRLPEHVLTRLLNTATRAQLSGECPWGSFAEYVEWVLVSCGSPLSGHRRRQHQPHSRPRAQPTITPLRGASARAQRRGRAKAHCDRWAIARKSDRAEDHPGARASSIAWPGVRATTHTTVDESEGAEKSPTHCTTAEGELRQEDLIDFYSDIPSLLP